MVRICPISLSAGERSCLTTVIYTFLSLSTLSGAGLLGYAGVVRLQLEDFEAVLGEGVSLHLPILLATAGCICLIIPILGVILINFSRSDSEAKEMSEESLKWLMRNMWRYNSLTIALIVVAATLTIAFVISSQQRDELATRVDQLFRLDFMRRPDVTPSLHLVQIQFSCCGPEGPAAFLQYLPAAEQGRQIFPFSCCNVSAAQCRRHHTTMVACRDVNDTLDSIDYAKCGLNQRGCRSPLISLIRKLTQPLAVAGICLTGLHVSIAILFRFLQTSMNAVHEAHGGEEFVAIGYLIGTGRNLMTEEPKMKEVVTSGGKAPAVEIHNEDNVAPLGKQKRETEKNEEETNQAK